MMIRILSRREAEAYVPDADTACVSVACTSDPAADLKPGWKWVRRLFFDDIDPDANTNRSLNAVLMTPAHAEEIVQAIMQAPPEVLVVHCFLGMSRSPAIALGLLDAWMPEAVEQYQRLYPLANAHVRSLVRNAAQPHAERFVYE